MTKSKAQKLVEDSRDDLLGILERLGELESSDPYVADAGGFIAQASVCLGKHLTAQFDWKPPVPKPEPEPAKVKAK